MPKSVKRSVLNIEKFASSTRRQNNPAKVHIILLGMVHNFVFRNQNKIVCSLEGCVRWKTISKCNQIYLFYFSNGLAYFCRATNKQCIVHCLYVFYVPGIRPHIKMPFGDDKIMTSQYRTLFPRMLFYKPSAAMVYYKKHFTLINQYNDL